MVGVVFIHFNTDAINPDAVNPNWLHYITSLFSYVLSAVCVPLFFFFPDSFSSTIQILMLILIKRN